MTQAEDGEWLALDGEAILKKYRLAAGDVYEAHLRNELTQRLGLPRLSEEWKARAAEHGLGRRELKRLGREPPRLDIPELDREHLAERLFGPDGLTAKQTTFALPELVCAVAGSLRDGCFRRACAGGGGAALTAS